MKNLADYISNNDDLMNSSTMKDNDTSNYKDVNEGQSTKLEQYINEQKINEEMNYKIFLARNYRVY